MIAYTKENYYTGGFQISEKIYVLKNPFTGEVFYIGKTKKPLSDRLHGHISAAKGKSEKFRNTMKDEYIVNILNRGSKPKIETIEIITPISYIEFLEVAEREIFWMKHFKESGVSVMNIIGLRIVQPNAKYLWYLECKEKEQVPVEYYYCGKNKTGDSLYHKERIIADGFSWKETEVRPAYNPYNNPIWKKKMGIEI